MNRKLLASAMTVGVLSAPVAIAVADTNDTNKNTDTAASQKQYRELVDQRIRSERTVERAEARRKAKAHKKAVAKKHAKKRKKLERQQAAAPQTQSTGASQQAGGGGNAGGGNAGGAEQFAACESGGDPNAVNPTSGARGKYQILPSTHDSLCQGMGYGADCAARVYAAQGSGAWAQCGG